VPRRSVTGIRGYYVDDDGRRRIDLRYTDAQGKARRYKEVLPLGTTARAAEERARQVLGAALTGRPIPVVGGAAVTPRGPTLGEAFDAYLEWLKTNRPKSWLRARSVKAVMVGTHGDVPIADVTPALLERHKTARLAKGAAPRTITKDLHVTARMAAVQEWPQAIALAKVPGLAGAPARKVALTPAQVAAVCGAWRHDGTRRDDRRFAGRVTLAALLSGMRLGEILTVRASEAGRVLDLSRTKQNRLHQIPVSAELAALIREALAEPKRPPGDGPIFVNRLGRPYTVDGFSKLFARTMDRIGLPDVTFHGLRSHVGSALLNDGERIEVVSKLLGHSSIAVTQRHYAHLTTEATTGAAVRLGKMVPKRATARPTRSRVRTDAKRRRAPRASRLP
jgi:integrase